MIRTLSGKTEVYQRKSETVSNFDQSNTGADELVDKKSALEKPQLITRKLEAVLRKPGSKQEAIIWVLTPHPNLIIITENLFSCETYEADLTS